MLNTEKTQLQCAACSTFVTLRDFKENCTFASEGRNWPVLGSMKSLKVMLHNYGMYPMTDMQLRTEIQVTHQEYLKLNIFLVKEGIMLGKQSMFSFSRYALEHKYMKHLNMRVCIS